jgi:hypothetical protein
MLSVLPLLQHAFDAVLSSKLAGNTSAAAALASALNSLVKRSVQLVKAAVSLQAQSSQPIAAAATLQDRASAAAACFPGAVSTVVVGEHLKDLGSALLTALDGPLRSAERSSSSSRQGKASAALLVVVLVRSLLQLADALQAAGPQLLFDCLMARPVYPLMWRGWSNQGTGTMSLDRRLGPATVQQAERAVVTAEAQWCYWQLSFLQVLQPLLACLRKLGMTPTPLEAAVGAKEDRILSVRTAAAAEAGVASANTLLEGGRCAADCDSRARSSTSSCSSNATVECSSSGSSVQQVKWGYLLHLQQLSPSWAAAAAAFDAKWPHCSWVEGSGVNMHELTQLFEDAISLCRALADAAPVTVVCNNPDCEGLADVSEAAASSKARGRCLCRYCSVACQAADWKRHKRACRRTRAAGFACAV